LKHFIKSRIAFPCELRKAEQCVQIPYGLQSSDSHQSAVKSQLVINLHMHDYNHSPQKYSNINTGLSTRSSALPLTNELMDHKGG